MVEIGCKNEREVEFTNCLLRNEEKKDGRKEIRENKGCRYTPQNGHRHKNSASCASPERQHLCVKGEPTGMIPHSIGVTHTSTACQAAP
jgi:hypothetical protein